VTLALLCCAQVKAATKWNAQAALGLNLNGVSYYTSEQPFLDIFKTTGISNASPQGWITGVNGTWDTGEEAYLQLDANGFPITLTASSADPNKPQKFSVVHALILFNLPNSNAGTGLPYRAGQYVVLYDGQGTLSYGGDATLASTSPGRDVLNVATPTYGGGIMITISSTDPNHAGNYLRNIHVVYAPEESLLASGQVFRPGFLAQLQNFRALRFMDWLAINNSLLSSWASRPLLTDGGWGSNRGVPLEIAIELCNAVGADCWLNVPHQADGNYITQMATLVHSMLNPSIRVYVEYSNETWNGVFQQYGYMTAQGQATWANASSQGYTSFDVNRNYYGMRVAQMADIWKSVWGSDFSRVTVVLGAQAANPYVATEALKTPLWTGTGNGPASAHAIGAVAIAPYFGDDNVPTSWLNLPQTQALNQLFAEINVGGQISGDYAGGYLKEVSGWTSAYISALAPYQLPLLAYEGGQNFNSFQNWQTVDGSNANGSSEFTALYTGANRDSRMATAYQTYFSQWKSNGGQLFMHYSDVSQPSQFGEWGALESFLDTTSPLGSAPPKWQALESFLGSDGCWWPACTGTVGGSVTPNAPISLQAVQ
jgi:hypothetical protein